MPDQPKPKIVSVVGTNASGKSALAVALALKFGGEVISADSRQIYRGLNLGTGKLTPAEMQGVPHHMLDIREPGESFSVADFQRLAYQTIEDILGRGKLPILAGGTGLYTRSVIQGYQLSTVLPDAQLRARLETMTAAELYAELVQVDPTRAQFIDAKNTRRLIRALEKIYGGDADFYLKKHEPRFETLQLGVTWPRPLLYQRVEDRLRLRLRQGMVEEVQQLLYQGVSEAFLDQLGLEYRFICRYLSGAYASYEEFYTALFTAIRRFAKRQMIWFKAEKDILWLDMENSGPKEAHLRIRRFLSK
jgi:tRNA dimethylallyltransferase